MIHTDIYTVVIKYNWHPMTIQGTGIILKLHILLQPVRCTMYGRRVIIVVAGQRFT